MIVSELVKKVNEIFGCGLYFYVESLFVIFVEYQKAVTKRQQLDAQLNENTSVKNELELLKDDGDVFKLIGPVLIKQDLEEAKQNVLKRMDYITGEL